MPVVKNKKVEAFINKVNTQGVLDYFITTDPPEFCNDTIQDASFALRAAFITLKREMLKMQKDNQK